MRLPTYVRAYNDIYLLIFLVKKKGLPEGSPILSIQNMVRSHSPDIIPNFGKLYQVMKQNRNDNLNKLPLVSLEYSFSFSFSVCSGD